MAVAGRQLDHLGGEGGRERVGVVAGGDGDHRRDAVQGGGLGGDRGGIGGKHGDRDLGARNLARAGDAARRRLAQLRAVVFGNDENLAHQTSPFFFSASTSSATSLTMMPLARGFGGSTSTHLRPASALTPSDARSMTSRGFFFAFMMSGSLT